MGREIIGSGSGKVPSFGSDPQGLPGMGREVHQCKCLAETLCRDWEHAVLFRRLATLQTDVPVFDDVEQLRWRGPTSTFEKLAARLDAAKWKVPNPGHRGRKGHR